MLYGPRIARPIQVIAAHLRGAGVPGQIDAMLRSFGSCSRQGLHAGGVRGVAIERDAAGRSPTSLRLEGDSKGDALASGNGDGKRNATDRVPLGHSRPQRTR